MQHVFFVTGKEKVFMTTENTEVVDFSKSVFYKIQQLAIYCDKMADNFFEIRNVDLTHDEFAALNFVLNNPDICQRDLAKLLLRDRVRAGRIITSLEDKGYIKRTNATRNNRLIRKLQITNAGKKIYNEQFNILQQIMKVLTKKFSEKQMNELLASLSELEKALSNIVEFNI